MLTIDELVTDRPYVVLPGVSWQTYKALTDALDDHKMRHCYDKGRLEWRSVANSVAWSTYRKFLLALGDYRLPHYYHRGLLVMMSPLKKHDWVKCLIARMIESWALLQHIPIQSVGSTTIYKEDVESGFEADAAYYIANEPLVGDKSDYDPVNDPPPDLIIEVDVTVDSKIRHPIYAALKVPEIWQAEKDRSLVFWGLNANGDGYEQITRSISFPYFEPEDFLRFIRQRSKLREIGVVEGFVKWAAAKYNQNR